MATVRKKIFGTGFYEDASNFMKTLDGADVECFQAGTSTAIPMYPTKTGGTPFYPSPPGVGLKTDSEGYFEFWIDYEGLIKLEISKLGYSTIVRDNVGTPIADGVVNGGTFV